MTTEELENLWGEDLFEAFAENISEDGWLTSDWADVFEKKYPDHTYYDKQEFKQNIYSRMYNLDIDYNDDETQIRPL